MDLPGYFGFGYDTDATSSSSSNNTKCTKNNDTTTTKGSNTKHTTDKLDYGKQGAGTERTGVIGRNDIGFLIWDKSEDRTAKWQLGSRLKTPTLPMWVTRVNDNYGVLFNPNKELMRSYHAENR
ncbi:MAG TPA: DUF4205 domain-containing protein [Candidatus Poseidoniales archaeon]|nr:DUF4205 domain-containing protein [Candidatus Poseidoniales archaeon]